MAKVMDKFLGFMGFNDEEEIIEEEYLEDDEREVDEVSYKKKRGQVVSIHSQKQVKVVVMEPKTYDDVQAIADNLKNRKSVVVNLENADKELAKRVVDFVSGAVYALNGSSQKVGNGIFLFAPSNVDISSVIGNDDVRDKAFFTWVR
ncbi:MAG: cell division protein SepF [Clostridia bacterium]|nr:cell division protein SepF [Clostridia bacterium]